MRNNLLGAIYQAALDPSHWPDALAMLADATGSDGAHVVVLDRGADMRPRLKVNGTRRMDPNMADRYMQEWHVFDPLLPSAGRVTEPAGTILLCHEFLSEDLVANSAYFQEFLIPHGGRYQAGIILENNDQHLMALDLHARAVPFEREKLLPWTSVIAHLRRAVCLSAILAEHLQRESLLKTAIDRQGIICVMVNDHARVVDQSTAAEAMLAGDEGFQLDLRGRVVLDDEIRTHRLWALIANACHGRGGGEIGVPRKAGSDLALRVIPAGVAGENPFSLPHSDCALLFIDASRPRPAPSARSIRQTLRCSPAEAEVAAALASGRAPAEIAAERATSINTVRTQIRSLLETTGTHRIAKLVEMINVDLVSTSKRAPDSSRIGSGTSPSCRAEHDGEVPLKDPCQRRKA